MDEGKATLLLILGRERHPRSEGFGRGSNAPGSRRWQLPCRSPHGTAGHGCTARRTFPQQCGRPNGDIAFHRRQKLVLAAPKRGRGFSQTLSACRSPLPPSAREGRRFNSSMLFSSWRFGAVAGSQQSSGLLGHGTPSLHASPGSTACSRQRRRGWLPASWSYKRSLPPISAFDLNNPNKGIKQPKPTDFFKASI